ncbi:MAG: hypothetical protein ABW182_14615 [Sphingomonas sp.]
MRRLEAEIARLLAVIEGAQSDQPRALERARDEGKAEGLRAGASLERERLEAVRQALAAAQDEWLAHLERLDRLAAQLVRTALEKLFDACNPWAPMVEQAVSRQVDQLGRSLILRVRLSPADFDGVPSFDAGGPLVELDEALPSGSARLELKLGGVDIDLPEQSRALLDLLATFAGEGAAT